MNVGAYPFHVSVTPDGKQVYVSNAGSDTVSVINPSTNRVIATIPAGIRPSGVAITPDGVRAYVTNGKSDTVSIIDTATNQVIATGLPPISGPALKLEFGAG